MRHHRSDRTSVAVGVFVVLVAITVPAGCSTVGGGSTQQVSRQSNQRPAPGSEELPADPSEVRALHLEDVDAVRDDNPNASWVHDLDGTAIMNGTTVYVASSDPAADISSDEALEACEAVRRSLVRINPAVVVEVRHVDTLMASGSGSRPCTAS